MIRSQWRTRSRDHRVDVLTALNVEADTGDAVILLGTGTFGARAGR